MCVGGERALLQISKVLKQGKSFTLGFYLNLPTLGPASGIVVMQITEIRRFQPRSSGQRPGYENLFLVYSQKRDLIGSIDQNAVPLKLKVPAFRHLREPRNCLRVYDSELCSLSVLLA